MSVTESPSDTPADDETPDQAAEEAPVEADASEEAVSGDDAKDAAAEPGPHDAFAAEVAAAVGATSWSAEHRNVKVKVPADKWLEALETLRDRGMTFFSFLSAIDWAKEVAVGDPVTDPDTLEERIEVLCRVSTVTDNSAVTLSTDLPTDSPSLPTAVGIYGGAEWHERETFEMFGVDFAGHPRLVNLYLPDAFIGNPLRKSYPLLSREVKPWPGEVDVEDMPSTENTEAGDTAGDADDEGDAE